MKYDAEKHRRRSIRLPRFDYAAPGAYFVTLCISGRRCILGKVNSNGTVSLNPLGEAAAAEWRRSAALRDEIELDAFVVMPNHVHGVVVIKPDLSGDDVGATGQSPLQQPDYPPRGPARRSLTSFVVGYKGAVTRRVNAIRKTPGAPVWQRNYYERIIRDDDELARARFYVQENPARWRDDDYNPATRCERRDNVTAVFR